jgi:hypothetical protein
VRDGRVWLLEGMKGEMELGVDATNGEEKVVGVGRDEGCGEAGREEVEVDEDAWTLVRGSAGRSGEWIRLTEAGVRRSRSRMA